MGAYPLCPKIKEQHQMDEKKVMLSGIQPSGDLHLGNYLGAIKNWAARAEEFDCYYFMADMHTITVRQDPAARWSSWPSTSPAAWILKKTLSSSSLMSLPTRSWAGYSTATPCLASCPG